MSSKIPVSVLIPAKNEQANLPACLTSLQMADEVFVVDSQSTDKCGYCRKFRCKCSPIQI
jgi:glycosyltransferase involved in cell wall biosynthesis